MGGVADCATQAGGQRSKGVLRPDFGSLIVCGFKLSVPSMKNASRATKLASRRDQDAGFRMFSDNRVRAETVLALRKRWRELRLV